MEGDANRASTPGSSCTSEQHSGKKKAHKHKSFWPVTGGAPDREARGQSFMCYSRNPRNINLFVRIPDWEDRWPGRPEKVLCAKVVCAFSASLNMLNKMIS